MLPTTKIVRAKEADFLVFDSCETITRTLVNTGEFEPFAGQLLRCLYPGGDVVAVDVGANIGTFTMPVARANPLGTVYAFEAQRTVFYQLCANVVINSLDNVITHHVGVGNPTHENEKINVPVIDFSSANNIGAVSLIDEVRRKMIINKKYRVNNFEPVPLRSLDELLKNVEKIDFLKIDVEGMEYLVLKGACRVLKQHWPIVFLESWEFDRSARLRIEKFFNSIDYVTHSLGNDVIAVPPTPIRSRKKIHFINNSIQIF